MKKKRKEREEEREEERDGGKKDSRNINILRLLTVIKKIFLACFM